MPTRLATDLLSWYAKNQRQLPWRARRDPYAILVSEVMLPATSVRRRPLLSTLAATLPDGGAPGDHAEPKACLPRGRGSATTAGLCSSAGRRRTSFGITAGSSRDLWSNCAGSPGSDRYTASAVAAFAFGADEIALDGNLRRVLAHVIDLPVDPAHAARGSSPSCATHGDTFPQGEASAFNQALMDLAAHICLPRHPQCGDLSPSVDMPDEIRGVQGCDPSAPSHRPRPSASPRRVSSGSESRVLIGPPTGRRPARRIVGIPRREMLEARDGRGMYPAQAARGTGCRGRGRRLAGDLPAFLHPFPRHDARLRVPSSAAANHTPTSTPIFVG